MCAVLWCSWLLRLPDAFAVVAVQCKIQWHYTFLSTEPLSKHISSEATKGA